MTKLNVRQEIVTVSINAKYFYQILWFNAITLRLRHFLALDQ